MKTTLKMFLLLSDSTPDKRKSPHQHIKHEVIYTKNQSKDEHSFLNDVTRTDYHPDEICTQFLQCVFRDIDS